MNMHLNHLLNGLCISLYVRDSIVLKQIVLLLQYTVLCTVVHSKWLVVWISSNAVASISVVALRQTQLVLGWVTICGRVNHFGM